MASELELREVPAGGFSLHSCSCCMHQLHSISLAHLTHSTLLCFIHSTAFHSLTSLILLCFIHSVHSISLTNFTHATWLNLFITQHFTYSLHSFYSASVIYYIAFHSLTSLSLLCFIRPLMAFPSLTSRILRYLIHALHVISLTRITHSTLLLHPLHISSITHFTNSTLPHSFIT